MALMQAKNEFKYTPFFYLCDRDKKLDTDHYNYIVFPDIIKDLIKEVNHADPSCFGKNERHYADYNFVHERTKYTVLHWLAYHNDSVSLLFILRSMWQPDF